MCLLIGCLHSAPSCVLGTLGDPRCGPAGCPGVHRAARVCFAEGLMEHGQGRAVIPGDILGFLPHVSSIPEVLGMAGCKKHHPVSPPVGFGMSFGTGTSRVSGGGSVGCSTSMSWGGSGDGAAPQHPARGGNGQEHPVGDAGGDFQVKDDTKVTDSRVSAPGLGPFGSRPAGLLLLHGQKTSPGWERRGWGGTGQGCAVPSCSSSHP